MTGDPVISRNGSSGTRKKDSSFSQQEEIQSDPKKSARDGVS